MAGSHADTFLYILAYTWDGPWDFPICSRTRLRMVSLRHRHWTQHILESSQRYLMDEKSSISQSTRERLLHWDRRPRPTLLGSGNLCELHLLQ